MASLPLHRHFCLGVFLVVGYQEKISREGSNSCTHLNIKCGIIFSDSWTQIMNHRRKKWYPGQSLHPDIRIIRNPDLSGPFRKPETAAPNPDFRFSVYCTIWRRFRHVPLTFSVFWGQKSMQLAKTNILRGELTVAHLEQKLARQSRKIWLIYWKPEIRILGSRFRFPKWSG